MGSVLTARLPPGLQTRLDMFSTARHLSRSEVIKAALARYLDEEEQAADALTLGEGDLSTTYKARLARKLRKKRLG